MNETDAIKGLAYAEGFLTAMAAVLQDREYVEKGNIGNITTATADVHRMLRSVATHIGGDANEIKGLREENERLTEERQAAMDATRVLEEHIREMRKEREAVVAFLPVPCDAYHCQDGRSECWAVPEKPECMCGGDKNKCDYYGG